MDSIVEVRQLAVLLCDADLVIRHRIVVSRGMAAACSSCARAAAEQAHCHGLNRGGEATSCAAMHY
jgi:hypothetical protein